jgi:hypothetical protein
MRCPFNEAKVAFDTGDVLVYSIEGGGRSVLRCHVKQGVDQRTMAEGLDDKLCHTPHWGYMIDGALHLYYGDGSDELLRTGDLFHLPAGHYAIAEKDSTYIAISDSEKLEETMKVHRANVGAE